MNIRLLGSQRAPLGRELVNQGKRDIFIFQFQKERDI
jgi:hypothetical protein